MAARGSSAWRREWWGASCKPVLVNIPFGRNGARISVDRRALGAFQEIEEIFDEWGYAIRPADTGAYNCRKQKGSDATSSHAWAIAVDVNWQTNPYLKDRLVTDMPMAMIEEIEALRTMNGAPVFRWGGDWDGRPDTPHSNYDSMHFEVIATPDELASGVAPRQGEDMTPPRTIQIKGEDALYAVLYNGRVEHITSPEVFFLYAAEGVVSGAKQRLVEPGSTEAKAIRLLIEKQKRAA